MIYTVTFNPALDYVVHMNELVLDRVNRSTTEEVYIGGKGINVSYILKQLGHPSIALGFVAGFTGKAIEDGLAQMEIDSDLIWLEEGMSRINVKIKALEETEINANGPKIPEEATKQLFEKIDHLTEGDTLVLAGSIPSSMKEDTYERIMERLDGKGVRIVVDATRDLLKKVLKYHPFLIKPNNFEIGEIFGVELKTEEELVLHAKKLQEMGAQNVLISMAGDGAILVAEDGSVHRIGVPEGVVKNSVGAGDSMVAGFLAGYMDTNDYQYALRMGTAAGSATAFSEGLGQKELIEELLSMIALSEN